MMLFEKARQLVVTAYDAQDPLLIFWRNKPHPDKGYFELLFRDREHGWFVVIFNASGAIYLAEFGTDDEDNLAYESEGTPDLIKKFARLYPRQWVAVKVTQVDELDIPVQGDLLTHSLNHSKVWQAVASCLHESYVIAFLAGSPIPPNFWCC